MAKRTRQAGRGISTPQPTANYVARPTVNWVTPPPMPRPWYVDDWGYDRRMYQPDFTTRPPAAANRNATRIVARDKYGDKIRRQTKAPLTFAFGDRVALCIRRKIRREVMHALGASGPRRGKKFKKPRFNFWSAIGC